MHDSVTKNLTIMFTDMKDFTKKTSHKSRTDIEHLLETHDKLLRPIFGQYHGTVIKTIGDAFLVTFESPTNAVQCGLAIQRAVKQYNEYADKKHAFEVRVAINTGEVHVKDNDIFGEPVNITARVEGIGDGGEILVTESSYLAMNKNEIPMASMGDFELKGIPYKVCVYKVVSSQAEKEKVEKRAKRNEQGAKKRGLFGKKEEEKKAEALIAAPAQYRPVVHNVYNYYGYQRSAATATVKKDHLHRHRKHISFFFLLLNLLAIASFLWITYYWVNQIAPGFFPSIINDIHNVLDPVLSSIKQVLGGQ